MAISRMDMERQLRAGGGIMTLEEPRQGYFLGKIVKKAKRAVKKITKSPLAKLALAGVAANYAPMLFGKQSLLKSAGGLPGLFSKFKSGEGMLGQLGNIFKVGGEAKNPFSIFRVGGGLLGAGAIAAPFLMGGDEEEVEEETPYTSPQASVEEIRDQARAYYGDPTNSALYFMPRKEFTRPFADGGLASMRPGYRIGGGVLQKAGQMIKSGVGKVKSLFDDADINVSIRDEDVMTDAGLQAQAVGQDVFITPKSNKAVQVMEELIDEGYDIAKAEDGTYAISSVDEGALDIITQRLRIGSKGADEFIQSQDYYGGPMDEESKMIYEALRNRKAEGGIMRLGYNEGESVLSKEQMAMIDDMKKKGMDMSTIESMTGATADQITNYLSSLNQKQEGGLMDLGGFEKDYREGGFVPIGAEERADDVPARLSKNEFVFTADAVRNAGQGDIDKGAEVMQNMMDNLEAGGTISEEAQGMENPAQAMFDQAQQLESRIE